jgi:hypothetical protein
LEIENLTSDLEYFENRVFQLESENLTLEITRLDNRILQLESENTALNNEIENLTTEIDELKDVDDEPDDIIIYGAFLLGIFGVLIAFTAIILISKKLGSQELIPKREESNDLNDTEEKDDLD